MRHFDDLYEGARARHGSMGAARVAFNTRMNQSGRGLTQVSQILAMSV